MSKMKKIMDVLLLIAFILGLVGIVCFLANWCVRDMIDRAAEKKATRELCYSAGYSDIKAGWCIKGIDAPVKVESLRGE